MNMKSGWIAVVTLVMVWSASGVYASGNIIAFQNDSCVVLHLEAEGNNACFGYGGCSLNIASHETKQVSLRPGVRPKWAQITVSGSCTAQNIELKGQCAVDLERAFRATGYQSNAPVENNLSGNEPIFEEVTGPLDAGVSFAKIKLSVGLCEEVDGIDHCDVRCTVD